MDIGKQGLKNVELSQLSKRDAGIKAGGRCAGVTGALVNGPLFSKFYNQEERKCDIVYRIKKNGQPCIVAAAGSIKQCRTARRSGRVNARAAIATACLIGKHKQVWRKPAGGTKK